MGGTPTVRLIASKAEWPRRLPTPSPTRHAVPATTENLL